MAKRKQKKIAKKASEITVFYSWQSDLPARVTRNAIKDSLRKASKRIVNDSKGPAFGKSVIVDEATRDVPGSPNIPEKIIEKILAADIFVADVSIVRSRPGDQSEGMPNSNVVFELGFAAATLGWERILLVVNEAHGSVKSLPFDFDRNRATPFKLTETEGSKAALTDTLQAALALIIKKDPPRVAVNTFDIAEIEHQRDLTNVKWLLGSLHWPSIEHHISSGPQYITRIATDFFDETKEIVSSPLFHIYDTTIKADIEQFFEYWADSLKYDHYTPIANPNIYKFKSSGISSMEKEEKHWEFMQAARVKMYHAMNKLLADLRAKFPEIDIQLESKNAAKRYDAEIAEIERRFSPTNKAAASKKKKKKEKRRNK